MKTKYILGVLAVAAILAGFLMKRGGDPSPPAPVAPSVTAPIPDKPVAATAGSGAVPGVQPPPATATVPGNDAGLQLSEEERKRLSEFEKSIDMIDTPSGKRPRRPF
jgi:hypothetical protein